MTSFPSCWLSTLTKTLAYRRSGAQVRLVRDGIVIHEGVLSSLQRFKDAVKEVAQGYECGIGIEKYSDIKVGDIIEAFVMEQIEV